jgi:membrane-associated protease RseP (regulator of RpoE activity)
MNTSTRNRSVMTLVRTFRATAIFLAMARVASADDGAQVAAVASGAVGHGAPAIGIDVEQRVRAELRAVITELVEAGAFGDQPSQQISLAVDAPAERVSNLGLLVDSANEHRDGLHVFGVTPGGGAERIGVRAGDVLVALNGRSLADNADAAKELRSSIDGVPNGGALAFDIRREGRALALSGALNSVYLPPMRLTIGNGTLLASSAGTSTTAATTTAGTPSDASGCGHISDFDMAPRQQKLHAARIISIDGVSPGPTGSTSFRVSAGAHSVKVAEAIESRYLSFNARVRSSNAYYKTLRIDVPPDTTVMVAARLNEDKRSEPKDGEFWDPVAWKQVAESCH